MPLFSRRRGRVLGIKVGKTVTNLIVPAAIIASGGALAPCLAPAIVATVGAAAAPIVTVAVSQAVASAAVTTVCGGNCSDIGKSFTGASLPALAGPDLSGAIITAVVNGDNVERAALGNVLGAIVGSSIPSLPAIVQNTANVAVNASITKQPVLDAIAVHLVCSATKAAMDHILSDQDQTSQNQEEEEEEPTVNEHVEKTKLQVRAPDQTVFHMDGSSSGTFTLPSAADIKPIAKPPLNVGVQTGENGFFTGFSDIYDHGVVVGYQSEKKVDTTNIFQVPMSHVQEHVSACFAMRHNGKVNNSTLSTTKEIHINTSAACTIPAIAILGAAAVASEFTMPIATVATLLVE